MSFCRAHFIAYWITREKFRKKCLHGNGELEGHCKWAHLTATHINTRNIQKLLTTLILLNPAFSTTWLETDISTTTKTMSKASASKTSYQFSKTTVTTTTPRPTTTDTPTTPDTVTKEKSTPRCHRNHRDPVKKSSLPFCDLRHRLINGAGSRHRDDLCQTKEVKKVTVPLAERLGRRPHRSTHNESSTRPSWTRSIIILGQQRIPKGRSGVWARLSNKNVSGQRSGSEPRNSKSSSSGPTRT